MKNNESKYKQVVNFVIDGIAEYCERHGVKDVNELIGALQC